MRTAEQLKKFQFKKGQSGNPLGPKRKMITNLKIEGYRMVEIRDTFNKIAAMTQSEFDEYESDPCLSLLEICIMKLFTRFKKEGKGELLEYLIPKKMAHEATVTIKEARKYTKKELETELKERGISKLLLDQNEIK